MSREQLIVYRDLLPGEGPLRPGEMRIYRHPLFSVQTRCAVVAEFRTADGSLSQVHRRLRSAEYFVFGPHGDDSQVGVYYPAAEAAVEDALNRHAAEAGTSRKETSPDDSDG